MSPQETLVNSLATQLREAEAAREPVPQLTARHPELDVEVAYAVQKANIAVKLAAGRTIAGRKVGLTSIAMQQQLGVGEPDYGIITDDMMVRAPAFVDATQLIAPRVEAEFAFRIGSPLPTRTIDLETLRASVDRVYVAMEIIDSRIENWTIGLADTIADNASSARLVVGAGTAASKSVFDSLPTKVLHLLKDGEPVASGPGSAVLGDPLLGALWVINRLAELGEKPEVGEIILAGAVHASVPLEAGVGFTVRAEGFDPVSISTAPLAEQHDGGRQSGAIKPARRTPAIDVTPLINADNGLIDRSIFTDTDIYQQELGRIFATNWLFLGHTDQVAKPGDFFTTYMGEDPIIVTLDKERRIHAYLNSCRHRGARVCRADFGSTKAFTCTYHGWSYDLTGALVSIPNKEGYPASFDNDNWGLVEVARLDVYKGLIFATWNPTAPALADALGGMRWYMDAMLDRDPEGTTVVGGIMKWELKGNWKLAAEQFATDWYHVNMSHASALMVMSPTGKGPKAEIANTPGRQYLDPAGHGAGFPIHPKSRFDAQAVHEYYDYPALRERLGDARVEGPMTTGHATVFPNFSYLPINGSIRVWHPKGPDRMEVWAWTLLDRSMPEDVREAQRLYNLRTFGPSGIFEQDDGENWSEIQAISHGFVTKSVQLNYQMGLGSERDDGIHPGTTSELYSDAAGRSFYRAWAQQMNTPAWHEEGHR